MRLDQREVISSYLAEQELVNHNIKSFNDFVKDSVRRVVLEVPRVDLDIKPPGYSEYFIEYLDAWVEKPQLREADGSVREILPVEVRVRDLVYEAPVFVKARIVADGVPDDVETINVGSIPVMLKSDLCYLKGLSREELIEVGEDPTDPGGYFIINGTERVIVVVEDLAPNKFFVQEGKSQSKYEFVGKIFSEKGSYKIPHELGKTKQSIVNVNFTRLRDIPFVVIVKALGIVKDRDIAELLGDEPELQNDVYINLYAAKDVKSMEDAVDFIARKARVLISDDERRRARIYNLFDKYFLPHISSGSEGRVLKARFLCKAVRKLLLVSNGLLSVDDKDHYSNKRLRLAGDLLEQLFRRTFRLLVSDVKYNYERLIKRGRIPSLQGVTRSKLLTSRVRSAMATGHWGNRDGVCQRLDRLNYFATISNLRRVVSLLSSSRENFEARDLHPTHWGKLCTSETPEGQNIGLRKHLASTVEITSDSNIGFGELESVLVKAGLKVFKGGGGS